ncbi:MAG TPA: hypothetical protein VHS96_04245 [Bacteroidia bacterium]|nr:hypothetical protein [Bacteroidia bacterium]
MADTPISPLKDNSQAISGELLLKSPTKSAFAGLRALFLIAALVSMLVQLLTSLGSPRPEAFVWTDYILAMVSVLLFGMFLLIGRRGGEIQLYTDRLEGRRSMGVPFSFPVSAITDISLSPKRLAIKGSNNEILLMEAPLETKLGGWVWMLKHYGHWDGQVWKKVEAKQADGFERATRLFLGSDGAAAFGDNGFLLQTADASWFFPESTMFPVKGQLGEPTRPYMRASETGATLFQIEPNPEFLPIAALCMALEKANLDAGSLQACLEELAENHGGNSLKASGPDGQLEGECMGYSVVVIPG